jgi:hypothetical protein
MYKQGSIDHLHLRNKRTQKLTLQQKKKMWMMKMITIAAGVSQREFGPFSLSFFGL